jgi:hypothetical protein
MKVEVRVCATELGCLSSRLKSLGCILTHHLQHAKTGLPIAYAVLADDALIHECREAIQYTELEVIVRYAHGLCRLQTAPADKHGQAREQQLVDRWEESIAPFNSVEECLLPGGGVTRASSEHWEPKPFEQRLRRHDLHAGRRELNREWQTIQAYANFGDSPRIARRYLEFGITRLCALGEQLHRFALRQRVEVRHVPWIRQPQRIDDELVLGGKVK